MAKDGIFRGDSSGILDTIDVLMIRLDLSGRVEYMNKKAREVLGYLDAEPEGVDWFGVHARPEETHKIKEGFRSFASGAEGEILDAEHVILTRTGKAHELRCRYIILRSDSGKPDGVLFSARISDTMTERERNITLHDVYYNAIISSIDEGIIFSDRDRKVRYLNPSAERMTGWKTAEAEGRGIWETLTFKDGEVCKVLDGLVGEALSNGKVQASVEGALLVSRKGIEIFVEGSIGPVYGADGKISGAVFVFRDVTERRQNQRTLIESQIRLQSIIAAMPLGMHQYRLEDSGDLIFMGGNPAADTILGIKHAALVGKKILDAFPSLNATDIPGIYRQLAEGGPPVRKEDVTYQDERIVGAYEVNAFNIGEKRMVAVFSDILERKKAEIERDRFFEISDDIVLQGNLEGYYTDINSAATRTLGWSREEFLSRPWQEFIHPDDLAPFMEATKGLMTGEKVVKLENRHRHKDGSYRWLSWSSMYIREDKKILSIVRDVTARRLEQESQQQKEKLESIGRLAGGVAHDFNNQLAGIMGCAEIIQARLPPESDLQEYISLIINSAKNSADLAGQLLAFARKGKFQIHPIDINAIIKEAGAILARTINRKIIISMELTEEAAFIMGDPSQMQNAVINLGLNARDAMPNGGKLVLHSEILDLDDAFLKKNAYHAEPGRFVMVSVGDTGIGIDETVREHLFEPFFTTKSDGMGTGLGLAAVYGIVKSHHGMISVVTEAEKGTMFRLFFPLSDKAATVISDPSRPPESRPVPPAATDRGAAEKASILVIDDEDVICLMAQAMLGLSGYGTTTFHSGVEAIKYLESHPCPDLILLDLIMPDLSGEEVFAKIRRIYPNARVLVSSGYSLDGAAQALLDKGAKGFIQKPYRKEALNTAVATALAKA